MVEKQLKDRIIETALTLFEKYGYHGVTVDRIVAECGASKGGFYHNFKSKDELLYHIHDVFITYVLNKAQEAYVKYKTPTKRLCAIIRSFVRVFHIYKPHITVFNQEAAYLKPEYAEKINEKRERYKQIIFQVIREGIEAKRANKTVRGYVSTVFGCPYEGEVSVERVIAVSERLFELGIDELSLGDTIGVANPIQVQRTLEQLLKRFPAERMALHFHNTRGMALANVFASLQMGMTIFDSSLGGLGGCPYAPGASGNLATDDLVYMLTEMGIDCDVQLEPLTEAARWIEEKVGRPLSSHHLHVVRGNAS